MNTIVLQKADAAFHVHVPRKALQKKGSAIVSIIGPSTCFHLKVMLPEW
jgi:hypothetical protein